MRSHWSFSSAGRLVFGRGSVSQLGRLTAQLGATRVLVITDPPLVRSGALDRVRKSLQAAGLAVEVFEGGEPEPSLDAAVRTAEAARRASANTMVGLGGGSNIDLAKVAAVLAACGGHPRDYFGFDQVPKPPLNIVAVPTTAGTGSEVSHSAVLTDVERHIKVSTLSPRLRPRLAVVDPELTLSCPPKVTADSGIDALTHAIEAMTAIDYDRFDAPANVDLPYAGRHPLGDCLAEKAIALIGRWLVRAVTQPGDIEARDAMSLAATLAGLAFSNCGVALVHALEYPLGGALHCSHGAGNGLLLTYVMRFNLPERQAAFARVAGLLGVATDGLSEAEAAEASIAAVERLRQQIGIPQRIREIGGKVEQLPEFAEKAFGIKRLLAVNPRQASQEDLLGILQAAF